MAKRLFALLLALLCLSGCTSTTTGEITPPSTAETGESRPAETVGTESTTEPGETEITVPTVSEEISETILMDSDGIKITAKSLDKSGWMGPELKLLIENNTAQNLTVQARSVSVNGYMVGSSLSADVAAGKKANDELTLTASDLETSGIGTITDIELSFHIFDSDSWDAYKDTDLVSVKTAAFGAYTQPVDDSGTIVYDDGGIKVVAKGLDTSGWMGPAVILYIQNDSGTNITVQARDESVNGFMLDASLSEEVLPGKRSIADMSFLSSQIEENEITDITEVEFVLHIFDTDTWDGIADSSPIKLTFGE